MSCGAKILLKDRYRALKLLGQGGFGKTFKAVDEDQPRKPLCVIKQFAFSNNHLETRQIALKLFYEEAQHLEALGKHDQIPELLAYFDVDGQPYLVQQFIDGQDLEQELATAGTFNKAKIRELLESLLPVLDFLHHQSPPVIHRDIKPANIIRRRGDGGLVLVDFGAAKQATQSMLAKTGTVIGSPEYTAPEQTRGKPVFASDIYSLGVTCIYLLTQVSPFDLFDMNQDAWVWRDYLVDNPVDEKLGKVLDKMIANVLPQRYQSAEDVLIALGRKPDRLDCPNPVNLIPNFSKSPLLIDPIKFTPQLIATPKTIQHFSFETTEFNILKIKTGFLGFGVQNETMRTKVTREAAYIDENLGNGINLEMVYIPKGSFWMGSKEKKCEQPIHKVAIAPFFIGKYTVTQKQYQAIMGENPSRFKGDNRPVENVSWNDAIKFCQKLSENTGKQYTLPSESQWEYASRSGGVSTPFGTMPNKLFYFAPNFADGITSIPLDIFGAFNINLDELVNCNNNRGQTTDVGSFPPNDFGLYDMHGNVWEWCLDKWHENYTGAPTDGSAYMDKGDNNYYLLRGGSWDNRPFDCRGASRLSGIPDVRYGNHGFRVVSEVGMVDGLSDEDLMDPTIKFLAKMERKLVT
jgi:formylglycine-generating enzyme required for sulfatase activity